MIWRSIEDGSGEDGSGEGWSKVLTHWNGSGAGPMDNYFIERDGAGDGDGLCSPVESSDPYNPGMGWGFGEDGCTQYSDGSGEWECGDEEDVGDYECGWPVQDYLRLQLKLEGT